jgi:uncharacterized protein YukE
MTETSVDTAEVQSLAGYFAALSETSSSLAQAFRHNAESAGSSSVLGDSRLVSGYESAYQQSLSAINQVTISLSAISKKLSVVADNVSAASTASTVHSSP